jgi:phosphoglycerol transferase
MKDPATSAPPAVTKKESSAPMLRDPLAPRYQAVLEDGWSFSKPGSPEYIASIYGLSVSEPWGRWTDGDVAIVRFSSPLPLRFSVELSGGAFGANVGKPVGIRVGGVERQVVFKGGPFENTSTLKADFVNESGSDTVTILLPAARPASAGDPRRLGLALTGLKIVPIP